MADQNKDISLDNSEETSSERPTSFEILQCLICVELVKIGILNFEISRRMRIILIKRLKADCKLVKGLNFKKYEKMLLLAVYGYLNDKLSRFDEDKFKNNYEEVNKFWTRTIYQILQADSMTVKLKPNTINQWTQTTCD